MPEIIFYEMNILLFTMSTSSRGASRHHRFNVHFPC